MRRGLVRHRDRNTRVWSNGISVDPVELDEIAMTPEFSRYRYLLRAAPGHGTELTVSLP